MEARETARHALEDAKREAGEIRAGALREAADIRLRAEETGRAEAAAALAAWSVRLSQAEAALDERHLDRSVALARLLAERLVGKAIAIEPAFVRSLALEALRELHGARRVRLVAHPTDAVALREALTDASSSESSLTIGEDEALTRGDLRIETELGIIEARLQPRLERLARHLRETLSQ